MANDLWQRLRGFLGFGLQPSARALSTVTKQSAADLRRQREMFGGNVVPLPRIQLEWHQADLMDAQRLAATGDLSMAGRLLRYMRSNGLYSGLLSTRTSGLVRLPRQFYGDPNLVQGLAAKNGTFSLFDLICPPQELQALVADGDVLGVGVAELITVDGRLPQLVRRDPEYLQYRWSENLWVYHFAGTPEPIIPGDGRWVLHLPYGREAPWSLAPWVACGRSVIAAEHAWLRREAWAAKHSMPMRTAKTPSGFDEVQREEFLADLIAYRESGAVELPPGVEVDLVESNGRGYEAFQAIIDSCNLDLMVALAGQVVSTEGGKGFSTTDLHRTIRQDLIQASGESLSHTLNTQVLPWVTRLLAGEELLYQGRGAQVSYDTRTPKDLASEASTLTTLGTALAQLTEALSQHEIRIDIPLLCSRFGVPIREDQDGDGHVDLEDADADAIDVDLEAVEDSEPEDQEQVSEAQESRPALLN